MISSRQTFDRILQTNKALGHENYGPLSAQYGFLPTTPPELRLPESHKAWDNVMIQLPDLFRTLSLRRIIDETLPVLPADANHLPDRYLLRASSLILSGIDSGGSGSMR